MPGVIWIGCCSWTAILSQSEADLTSVTSFETVEGATTLKLFCITPLLKYIQMLIHSSCCGRLGKATKFANASRKVNRWTDKVPKTVQKKKPVKIVWKQKPPLNLTSSLSNQTSLFVNIITIRREAPNQRLSWESQLVSCAVHHKYAFGECALSPFHMTDFSLRPCY